MRNDEIVEKLNNLHAQSFSLDEFDKQLQTIKEQFVRDNNQEEAKLIWIYQTIVQIHSLYINSFSQLKNKLYYEAWCQLERIEITFSSLKRHFSYNKIQFFLWHIEKSVKNLQVIFPYKVFMSSEILTKKKKCSVCDKEISIRNSCGHIVGEIYDGEMCHRIVTEADVLGVSIVENPGNKYSVPFLKDDKTEAQIDQYNYNAIELLFEHITSPYESWDLEVSQRVKKQENYSNIGRNDTCSCGSGKKFKQCCMKKIGEKYPHYEFKVRNPSDKMLIPNTLKEMNASR